MIAPRVVAIVQARLSSVRFPRKSIAPFRGKPMILHIIERVRQVPSVDAVVAVVPTDDTALIEVLLEGNLDGIVRGSERDVLTRFWMAASRYGADVVMRVTGDCPLWSPLAGEGVLQAFLNDQTHRQFWSNDTTMSGWPDGTDVEVFSFDLLRRARHARLTVTASDREHVTTWMRRTEGRRCGVYTRPADALSRLKLSVDTITDLLRIELLDDVP
jgi:spore coat polysaccharide biosynthesis protein SpsF (cytidylyltransferase family)